jgi:hypothetical protein
MKTHVLLALVSFTACTRPAPRAPAAPSHGVVIMSMHDVEPYERVPPPTPKPPPRIEIAAPLSGALSGAAMGLVLFHGFTLLTEHRFPSDSKYDRERQGKAILYGAGIGLAAGTFMLAHSLAERVRGR